MYATYCDVVAWTAKIMAPNNQTIIHALKACNSLAALEGNPSDGRIVKIQCLVKGRKIHYRAVKRSVELARHSLGRYVSKMWKHGGCTICL